MVGPRKTVRIFISSTFRDMHVERDHLVRFVFPELKERCRKLRVQLIDVDLRWGVTEEDANAGKALDICLDEIDTCRPYFLGLLGFRYGYVPAGHQNSITAQEIYHGVLRSDLPKQVRDLRKIFEGKLEGRTLSNEEANCLVRCYPLDGDKGKYLLRTDVSADEERILRSVFQRYSIYQKDRSYFFFRSEALTSQLAADHPEDYFEFDQDAEQKLVQLKAEIRQTGLTVHEYNNLESFGQLVRDVLWTRIEAEAELPVVEEDWLEQEAEFHELFMADRTRRFVGRRDLLDRMHVFSERKEEPSLLVITGEPGCGKSALMARFTDEVMQRYPDWLIICHFVGASPASTNLRRMLRRFCTQLNRAVGSLEETPEDIKELLKLFPELLTKASANCKSLFIIDAVNQLEKSDNAQLKWFPQQLPSNARFVISTVPELSQEALLTWRIQPQVEVVNGLHVAEIQALVERYLKEISHQFPNPKVEGAFYRKVHQGNPLYILVALEELRLFGHFEQLGKRIQELPDTVSALFDQVLQRIEADFDSTLVSECMIYLASGRNGMTAEELQYLLRKHTPLQDSGVEAEKFPDMLWARLYRAFIPYLFERSGVIDFFHNQFKEAVGARYLQYEGDRDVAHRIIADYFESRWNEPYTRALAELPHQRMKSKDWQGLQRALCDLAFMEKKCRAGMTFDLVTDYNSALSIRDFIPALELIEFGKFMAAQSHLLALQPELAFQQAANEPDLLAPAKAARTRHEAGLEKRPWLQWLNKPQESSPCFLTLSGHSKGVRACAVSPDGKNIVSASYRALKLWNAATGLETATILAHDHDINDCTFSPNGKQIASGSSDNTVKVWDASTASELCVLMHDSTVNACAFSPDAALIVSGCADETLHLWNWMTGKTLRILQRHTRSVADCTFSPDGNQIVSASDDGTLMIWDVATGQELRTLAGHTSWVTGCAFSRDGNRIISASMDRTIRLWDTVTGVTLFTLTGHRDVVVACAFSPDGSQIASASHDCTLKLWNATTGNEIQSLTGHTSLVQDCAFFPMGDRLISASVDLTLKLWDISPAHSRQPRKRGHAAEVTSCAISPDQTRIVSASKDGTLKLWDSTASIEMANLVTNRGVNYCVFSPNGKYIASSCSDGVTLWDARSGRKLSFLPAEIQEEAGCAFSPDASCLVSAAKDKSLRIWDSNSGRQLKVLTGHVETVTRCCFSRDSLHIASVSRDKQLILWGVKSGKKLLTLIHPDEVYACDFSPDGRRVVSGGNDTTLVMWDVIKHKKLAILTGHTNAVTHCSFSPDGKRILSSSRATLKLWDAATFLELATIRNRYSVSACSFSPDQKHIAYATLDETMSIWNIEKLKKLCVYKTGGDVTSLNWSPDSCCLVIGTELGGVEVLKLVND